MSASREKKNRQELAANGIPDPKKVREAEDRRAQRRANRLYGGIAAAFVVLAIGLILWNSNIFQRTATALTVDGVKYTAAEVDYYYYSTYSSLVNSSYASWMELSRSTDLNSNLNDMAKMILQVEEDTTWDAYFKDSAKKNLIQLTKLKAAAKADGFAFTDEMQSDMDETLASLNEYASEYGYSPEAYLKLIYGNNMTLSCFKKMLKDSLLVSHYQDDYAQKLTYTDEELADYYAEHSNDYDLAAYDYITFRGTASSTTDEDGNTVEPTEEESAAALEAAKTAANEALERYRAGESLEEIADDYEIASYSSLDAGSYSDSALGNWVFDSARKADDNAVVEGDSYYYVAVFHSRAREEYNTVDVRHILFTVDSSALDSESDTYEEELAKLDDAAKSKAEETLQQWKDGDATEESFAALANELSDDTGSNTNGGLYEQIYRNQMVTEFNDWIFDESRQSGDTGIVYNSGAYTGYHIIYFVGENDPYWMVQVRSDRKEADYTAWLDGLVENAVVTEGSGMEYVG
ncbi:MAG: peptidylprolyl isomerase [Oscillospiraceae bacterium]|nr:peptidylprolyl isomerase [Oscillospiraceae bacterium]